MLSLSRGPGTQPAHGPTAAAGRMPIAVLLAALLVALLAGAAGGLVGGLSPAQAQTQTGTIAPPPTARPGPDVIGSAPPPGQRAAQGVDLAMRPVPAPAPRPGRKPTPPRPDVADLIAAAGLRPDQVGYVVLDLETGERLDSHNAGQSTFLPASVMKVPTTLAALALLGPDHRFSTVLRFDGTRTAGGVWRGTLTLVGGGDPVLESDDLRDLAAKLKAAGLRRLDGTFRHDDSALPGRASLEPTQPPEHAYNPGLSALSLDFNRVRVRWDTDSARLIEIHGTPPVAPIRIHRDGPDTADDWSPAGPVLRHGFAPIGTRDVRGPVVETWRLSPVVGPSGERWLPVRAPAPFTATVFHALAAEAGIVLPQPAPATTPARGPIVARHDSPRLEAIAAAGLEYSNNLLAEMVGLATTRALTGRPLTIEQSAPILADWLSRAVPGVDWSGFEMANHSGLSPANRATPEQIAALLRFAHAQGATLARAGDYLALLPRRQFRTPGNDSVARLARAGATIPRVWAKSGTIYHGRGLAGVLQSRGGRRLVFTVFTADLAARRAFDQGYLHYSGHAIRQARSDLRRARDLEHALLLKWMVEH